MKRATSLLLAAAALGCVLATRADQPSIPRLSTRLATPLHVELAWSDEAGAAGHVVEVATDPAGTFNILEFMTPQQRTLSHGELMAQTRFYYRVRGYFGPASQPVLVSTAQPLFNETKVLLDENWADPRTLPSGTVDAPQSIRDPRTAAESAPARLHARMIHATGIQFTWTDRSSDEDGFLLEARTPDMQEFRVVAMIDPDVNCYGYAQVPPGMQVIFRIRAYYFGRPSNLENQLTGISE